MGGNSAHFFYVKITPDQPAISFSGLPEQAKYPK